MCDLAPQPRQSSVLACAAQGTVVIDAVGAPVAVVLVTDMVATRIAPHEVGVGADAAVAAVAVRAIAIVLDKLSIAVVVRLAARTVVAAADDTHIAAVADVRAIGGCCRT